MNTLLRALVVAFAFQAFACGPSDGAKRYPLTGKVEGVDLVDKEVLVAHEDIKDFMPAMTMPFRMPPPQGLLAGFRGMKIERIRRGDVISATLAVKENESWIENVEVIRYEPPLDMPAPPPKQSKVGERVHDFALIDQDNKPVTLADYKGHVLALTFIYTRCPLPEFCPRIMKNFQELDKAIEGVPSLRDNARLLSVSFDVEFDRPDVLNAFGSAFVTDRGQGPFARWKLATGTKEEIDQLGRFFGLIFFKEGSQFSHSLVTVIIGPDGKLVREFSGNDWIPEDALEAMKRAVPRQAAASKS
ncbi:MAG: SCO family protein [Vicinamibacteria bacterium]